MIRFMKTGEISRYDSDKPARIAQNTRALKADVTDFKETLVSGAYHRILRISFKAPQAQEGNQAVP